MLELVAPLGERAVGEAVGAQMCYGACIDLKMQITDFRRPQKGPLRLLQLRQNHGSRTNFRAADPGSMSKSATNQSSGIAATCS